MKHKVLCYLLCVSFFVCSLSLSSSAAERIFDNEYDFYEAIYGDLNPEDDYILQDNGQGDWSEDEISFFDVSGGSKNQTNFDQSVLNMIDLNSIPKEVYDIIHSDNRLIILQVWPISYRIFVLRNGFVYKYIRNTGTTDSPNLLSDTSNFFGIGTWVSNSSGNYEKASCLYEAIYSYDGSLLSNWKSDSLVSLPSKYVGTHDECKAYRYEISADNSDFYSIGDPNSVKAGTSISTFTIWGSGTYGLWASNSLRSTSSVTSAGNLCMGRYLSRDELTFPSFESQTNDTQKGIFQQIKDLPDTIAEKLKALFIPSDDYFSNVWYDLSSYLCDKLGLFYDIPHFFVGIIEDIYSFDPETENYLISFPEIKSFYIDSSGNKVEYVLFDEHEYNFDILSEPSVAKMYDFYVVFIKLVYMLALFYLIYRKSEKIFSRG